jgi:hypothetical protein
MRWTALMGKGGDAAGIQFRMLNRIARGRRAGPARPGRPQTLPRSHAGRWASIFNLEIGDGGAEDLIIRIK